MKEQYWSKKLLNSGKEEIVTYEYTTPGTYTIELPERARDVEITVELVGGGGGGGGGKDPEAAELQTGAIFKERTKRWRCIAWLPAVRQAAGI